MNKTTEKTEKIIFLTFTIVLIALSVYFSVVYFSSVPRRLIQSIEDFGRSVVYYVHGFNDTQDGIKTTVQEFPVGEMAKLPITPGQVKTATSNFGELLFDKDNFLAYVALVAEIFSNISLFIMICTFPLALLFLLTWLMYRFVDNETGELSFALKIWYKLEDVLYFPIKRFIVGYWAFLKEKKRYSIPLALIWLYNVNAFTIAFEFVAFMLWLPWSLQFWNIFVQLAKLVFDLSAAVEFFPTIVWLIIGYKIFDVVRRWIGFNVLDAGEKRNKAFLLDHPGNLLATGKPRVGKTQTITDMTLSMEVIYREMAQKKSLEHHMEFPFFPWGVLEQSIIKMRERAASFSLTFIRGWIENMHKRFVGRAIYSPTSQAVAMQQLKNLGYQGDDFIFGYDFKRYPMTYDNELSLVNVFEAVELYAEEFYIYTHPTPLTFGNYPIRSDIGWKDFGNYPIMKSNFFKRTSSDREKWSQFNHIVNHDALRLGRKKDPTGEYNNAYDIGCLTLSELGKELGNQNTNRGKEKNSNQCNANNDLWTTNAKMISHGTTIDYFTYFRILSDEQRAMSILADFREIGSEMPILKKHDAKIKMPFFAFGELFFVLSQKLMKKIMLFFKSRHGKMTLFFYLSLRLYSVIFNKYTRVFNRFAVERLDLKVADQSVGEEKKGRKVEHYDLARYKICSDRYNTGFFNTYYKEKFKKSRVGGLDRTPQFKSLEPTVSDMRYMQSHFNEEVFDYFGIAS